MYTDVVLSMPIRGKGVVLLFYERTKNWSDPNDKYGVIWAVTVSHKIASKRLFLWSNPNNELRSTKLDLRKRKFIYFYNRISYLETRIGKRTSRVTGQPWVRSVR